MTATYVFRTDLYIGANSWTEARDGLMELLAEIVRGDDNDPFDLIDMIYEEQV